MWPFGKAKDGLPTPTQREILRRLEELEDKYSSLERRFVRMQGEFSAYERWRAEDIDDDLMEEEDEVSQLIRDRQRHG